MIPKEIRAIDAIVAAMEKDRAYTTEEIQQAVGNMFYGGACPLIVKRRVNTVLCGSWTRDRMRRVSRGVYCLQEAFEHVKQETEQRKLIPKAALEARINKSMVYHRPYTENDLITLSYNTKNLYLYRDSVHLALKALCAKFFIGRNENGEYYKASPQYVLRWFNGLEENDKHEIILSNTGVLKAFYNKNT